MSRPAVVVLFVTAASVAWVACSLAFPTRESSDAGSSDVGTGDVASSSGASSSGGDVEQPPPGSRSCASLAKTCGAGHDKSCCDATNVPGGTFFRSYDGLTFDTKDAPATVSAFSLDTYEVTVGRFRAFLQGYARPQPAQGRNPRNGADQGWLSTQYDPNLPDAAAIAQGLKGCNGTTWTDAAGTGDSRAMNCMTWYEAFAFCIWDDARLPTEAEWNFAAAGGDEQRAYPWDGGIDPSRAVFQGAAIDVPGSRSPAGDGKWLHADLAGNVAEWVIDTKDNYQPSCNDCGDVAFPAAEKIFRGGGFDKGPTELLVSARDHKDPLNRLADVGLRCAR